MVSPLLGRQEEPLELAVSHNFLWTFPRDYMCNRFGFAGLVTSTSCCALGASVCDPAWRASALLVGRNVSVLERNCVYDDLGENWDVPPDRKFVPFPWELKKPPEEGGKHGRKGRPIGSSYSVVKVRISS